MDIPIGLPVETMLMRAKAAVEALPSPDLPYRDRAEMYALKDGKLFGSRYPHGGFGVYGGGIDPGEDPAQAAAREFQEESGWAVSNPRLLPVDPHVYDWKPPYASPKQAERAKQFKGSRTYYVVGDLGDPVPGAKVDELGRTNAGLYDFDEAERLSAPPEGAEPAVVAGNANRLKVLQHLRAGEASVKSAFYAPHLLFVKRAKDEGAPFTIAVDLDGTLAKQEKPFNPKTIGDPRPETVRWVRLFHKLGARIIIFTVRGDREMVAEWLEENDVPYDHVNENPDQPKDSSGKVIADAYWDDRAFNAEDPDDSGPEILRRLLAGGEDTEADHPGLTICHTTTVVLTGPQVLSAMEDHDGDEPDDADGE